MGLDQPSPSAAHVQAIGMLLRNQLYAGLVDVPEYGVRGRRGDFEPLISEELFYRVQAILSGHVPNAAPRKRAHPDFPLRAFVRCASCGTRTDRQLVERATYGLRWRFANARAEPDLR